MSRRARFFSAAIVAAGLAMSAPAAAQTFSKTTHVGLFDPLVADLNGDGHMDLAGTAAPGNAAGVMLNNGSGAFGPVVTYPAGGNAMTIAGGDLNNDGRFDLVVTINQADIGLGLLFGNGNGTFQPPVNLPNTAQGDAATAVVADLDNDGKRDIVIAHGFNCYGSGCFHVSKMSILMGNGDGTFEPTRVVDAGQGMNKIAVGDFNRDNIKDLAISASGARLYRFQGVGDGTFTQFEVIQLWPAPNFAEGSDIDVADLNRDSIEDLVVALSTDGSRLAIVLGDGQGGFASPLIYTDPNLNVPQEVVVADYNGDGLLDLAYGFANGNQGLFAIRNGNGNGTFQAQRMYEVPPNQSSIGTVGMVGGNFNADTKPDLALSIGGAQSGLWVLLNTTGQAPPPTPGAPTLISPAQDARPTQVITFDWSDVANATSYRIQVDDANTFATSLAFDRIVTPSTFTAPYFLNIRQYWWRVRAINSAGVAGPYSSVRRFTPSSGPAPTTPAAPTLLSPADNSSPVQPLTLDWSDVTDAANYRVQIDDSSDFSTPMIVDQTVFGSQFNAPNMTATQVWWRVRGVNSAGTAGPFSLVGTFFPQAAPPPAAPTLVTPLDGSAPVQPVAFDWDAVTGAANYRIQIDNSSDFSSPVVDNTDAPSAFTAPMLAATQHWWRVRAINSAGTAGPYSAVRSITPQGTTPPPPPPPPDATLSSLSLNPASVTGGNSSLGTVTLTAAAPTGGAAVALSSSNPGVASVPGSVIVATGSSSASFSVSTSAVGAITGVTLTGTDNGTSRAATLTVTPVPPPPPPPPPPPGEGATLTVTTSGRSGERVTSSPAGINVAVPGTQAAPFTTGTSITLSATNGRDVIWSGACSSGGAKRKTCVFTFSGVASVNANVQ